MGLQYIVGEKSLHWTISPTEEPEHPNRELSELAYDPNAGIASKNDPSNLDILAILLFLILGLFSGAFSVALLFRRIAIALAVTGPMLFSVVWIGREWKKFGSRQFAFGAFTLGYTLTFLALDREA